MQGKATRRAPRDHPPAAAARLPPLGCDDRRRQRYLTADARASRRAANELSAGPVLRLHVVGAGRGGWTRIGARVHGRAVRVVDARVRRRMAIVGDRPFAALGGGAIAASATVRIENAIASGYADVRARVGGRAAAQARGPRGTLRIGRALVVRTPARPDQASKGKATTVESAGALGIRSATNGLSGAVRLARRCRTALRGAARRLGPMVDGDLRVARQASPRFDEGRLAGRGARGPGRSAARVQARPDAAAEDEGSGERPEEGGKGLAHGLATDRAKHVPCEMSRGKRARPSRAVRAAGQSDHAAAHSGTGAIVQPPEPPLPRGRGGLGASPRRKIRRRIPGMSRGARATRAW